MARLNKTSRILLLILSAGIVLLIAGNLYVNLFSGKYLFNDTATIPHNKCGLILGTSKYLLGGGNNAYFDNRIEAAAFLFQSGFIKQIICSGDNMSDKYYNEPKAMSKALQKLGVPDSVIWLDREGLSTRKSVQNFIRNYDINSVTIITQEFHNERAVFIARKSGLDAIGFNARDVDFFSDPFTHIREWFAKIKAVGLNIF